MARNFQSRVQHVAAGSPVSAGNASRPSRQLEARTNLLQEEIDAIEAGRLLIMRDQTIDPDVLEGQPVYWNTENQRYEQCLAGVENDTESGTLVPLASADCQGMVYVKKSATLADIALVGMANFESLANAIDGDLVPGRYYLSAADAGKLTRQRPAATVAVCYVLGAMNDCDTSVWVMLLPQMRDFQEDHIHYRFDLNCSPAGTHVPPAEGDRHEITDADDGLAGWLPADHESFAGHAPTGAAFGYNLAAHEAVSNVWPPVPVDAALLLWDKGAGDLTGASEVPSRGTNPLVIFDRYGIWWMSDCYGDVPWPKDLDTTVSSSLVSESVSSSTITCPRPDNMRLILAFLHMVFATDRTVVTSLQPGDEQPIEFVDADGEVATTGNLYARLALAATIDTAEHYGGVVFKTLVGAGLKFGTGYVAEGLLAGSDNVVLSSTRQRYRTPGDSTTPLVHQGLATVDVDLEPGDRELSPQIVKLGDVLEREFAGLVYLAFPPDRDSGVRLSYHVPGAGLPVTPTFKLRAWIFGRGAAGPLPAITVAYHRLILPTDGVPTPIVEGDTLLTFDVVTPSAGLDADEVILVESEAFTIAAGDTITLAIERANDAVPVYDNDFGLIRAIGIIAAGA